MIENVYTVSSAKMKLKASETTQWKILWKIMERQGEAVQLLKESSMSHSSQESLGLRYFPLGFCQ